MSSQSTAGDASPTSLFERIFRTYHAAGFLPIVLPVLLVAFALFVPNFIGVGNIFNVLRSSSYLVIIAAGQMLVLIVGGFDLSGRSLRAHQRDQRARHGCFQGYVTNEPGLIILVGVLAGLGCGVIVGLVNGLCVAFLRISPFMVTLGTMSIATGCALLLTSGIPVYGMPKSYVEGFGRALWLDLPSAFWLAAAVVAVIWVMQNYTRMGRYILAIGGNMQAAVVSGVPAKTYLILSYVMCSVLASISGLAFTAQLGSGQAVIKDQLTLEEHRGRGDRRRQHQGRRRSGRDGGARRALLLLTLTDAMDLLRIDPRIQAIFLGIIVVGAVALDELSQRRAALV